MTDSAEVANLKKEIEELKQANTNIIQFTFSIINSLDVTAKTLTQTSNALFTISDKLKAVINQNSS